jgi:hypothetical protein
MAGSLTRIEWSTMMEVLTPWRIMTMKSRLRAVFGMIAGICMLAGLGLALVSSQQNGAVVMKHASGPFEVKMTPQEDKISGTTVGRMNIDKQFHGDLEATSKGQMLMSGIPGKGGSAGYVAMEQVTGTLHGRSGTFFLQHSGTMTRGVPQLSVTVVPDSGTGQLVGLAGKMGVRIEADGKHFYEFEYTLAETH